MRFPLCILVYLIDFQIQMIFLYFMFIFCLNVFIFVCFLISSYDADVCLFFFINCKRNNEQKLTTNKIIIN